jgi:XTP/dITP diphosphohydrolase
MEWVIATQNPGKLREVRAILADFPVTWCLLTPAWAAALPKEGGDYETNALAKARAVAQASGRVAVADDSGLEVDALGGLPGPHSARYGGPGLDDVGRIALLLHQLGERPPSERAARFVCVAAAAQPTGPTAVARGICPGHILAAARGTGGFGYDPIFQPPGHEASMAQLAAADKERLSHRGRAFRALRPHLERWLAQAEKVSR